MTDKWKIRPATQVTLRIESGDEILRNYLEIRWRLATYMSKIIQSELLSCIKQYIQLYTLREKCPNTELFLVRIFLYSVRIQENTDQK